MHSMQPKDWHWWELIFTTIAMTTVTVIFAGISCMLCFVQVVVPSLHLRQHVFYEPVWNLWLAAKICTAVILSVESHSIHFRTKKEIFFATHWTDSNSSLSFCSCIKYKLQQMNCIALMLLIALRPWKLAVMSWYVQVVRLYSLCISLRGVLLRTKLYVVITFEILHLETESNFLLRARVMSCSYFKVMG